MLSPIIETKKEDNWLTGSNKVISFDDLCTRVSNLVKTEAKIYIGSDSDVSNKKITFCKAICIHGNGTKSIYFFKKHKVDTKKFPNIISRITEETRLSVEMADLLINKYGVPRGKIELHLDVSPIESKTKTSKFSDMLKGYVNGAGLTCKIKPDAWASQSVADRHSK